MKFEEFGGGGARVTRAPFKIHHCIGTEAKAKPTSLIHVDGLIEFNEFSSLMFTLSSDKNRMHTINRNSERYRNQRLSFLAQMLLQDIQMKGIGNLLWITSDYFPQVYQSENVPLFYCRKDLLGGLCWEGISLITFKYRL